MAILGYIYWWDRCTCSQWSKCKKNLLNEDFLYQPSVLNSTSALGSCTATYNTIIPQRPTYPRTTQLQPKIVTVTRVQTEVGVSVMPESSPLLCVLFCAPNNLLILSLLLRWWGTLQELSPNAATFKPWLCLGNKNWATHWLQWIFLNNI